MGIGDVVSKVVTEFKADTKDHKKKLRELKGIEKDRQRALIDGLEKQNKKLDDQIGTMGKMAIAVGVVAGAYKSMSAGFKLYAEQEKYVASGAGKNMEALRKASHGLMTDQRILKLESQLLNGAFKITNEELVRAFRGMVALSKAGNDFEEVQTRVGIALVKGNTRPLEEFGVAIKGTKLEYATFQKILTALDEKAQDFAGNLTTAGDKTKRQFTAMKNAGQQLAIAWGKFADDVLPPFIRGLARVITNLKNIVGWAKAAGEALGGAFVTHSKKTKEWLAASPQEKIAISMRETEGAIPSIAKDMWGERVTELAYQMFSNMDKVVLNLLKDGIDPRGFVRQQLDAAKKAGFINMAQGKSYYKKVENAWRIWNTIAGKTGVAKFSLGGLGDKVKPYKKPPKKGPKRMSIEDILAGRGGEKISFESKMEWYRRGYAGSEGQIDIEADQLVGITDIGKHQEEIDKLIRPKKDVDFGPTGKERLASMFGEPSEIFTIANAYGALNEAVVGSFGAWIDGTESVGAAFKRMTKEILKSIAMQSAAEALKYTAYGIAALVDPTLGSSSAYFMSAAKFGAAAAIAGKLSKEIGGGGAPSTAAGAMARGGGGGSRQQTIILGADFESDSARRRAHRLNDILSQANRLGAGETVVEFG